VTVPNSHVQTVAGVASRLGTSMQRLSLLTRDRDSSQQPQAPATLTELDALSHRYAQAGVALPQSYLAFLAVHNGWRWFSGDSHMLSTTDHGAPWVTAAIAERQWLTGDRHLAALVPVLLGTRPSSLAAFLDPSAIAPAGEPEVVLMDGCQLLTRCPGFLPFLAEWERHLERAIRIQVEGDEP
jgi:hypothetical protein